MCDGRYRVRPTGRPVRHWYPRRVPDPNEPTGYRLQVERYEPRAEEAAALAYCYHSYINGTGFVDLARYLNEQGFRTTRGRAWKQDTLLRSMDSGFAAGYLQVCDSCDCPKSRAATGDASGALTTP